MKKLASPIPVKSKFGAVHATHMLHEIHHNDGAHPVLNSRKSLAVEVDGKLEEIPGTESVVIFQGVKYPGTGWSMESISALHDAAQIAQTKAEKEATAKQQEQLKAQIAAAEKHLAELQAHG
jgi:hypothetical protein